MPESVVGRVSYYYSKLGVAVVQVSNNIVLGDKVRILGSLTDFSQEVSSMQIDRELIERAEKGHSIGLKVDSPVRGGDVVLLMKE